MIIEQGERIFSISFVLLSGNVFECLLPLYKNVEGVNLRELRVNEYMDTPLDYIARVVHWLFSFHVDKTVTTSYFVRHLLDTLGSSHFL